MFRDIFKLVIFFCSSIRCPLINGPLLKRVMVFFCSWQSQYDDLFRSDVYRISRMNLHYGSVASSYLCGWYSVCELSATRTILHLSPASARFTYLACRFFYHRIIRFRPRSEESRYTCSDIHTELLASRLKVKLGVTGLKMFNLYGMGRYTQVKKNFEEASCPSSQ